MPTKRATLKIYGLVQGVGYRYMSQKKARELRFTGFVHNQDDGTVEVVAEGPEDKLKDFTRWCYNGVGPAMVHKIEESWSSATGEFSDFTIND